MRHGLQTILRLCVAVLEFEELRAGPAQYAPVPTNRRAAVHRSGSYGPTSVIHKAESPVAKSEPTIVVRTRRSRTHEMDGCMDRALRVRLLHCVSSRASSYRLSTYFAPLNTNRGCGPIPGPPTEISGQPACLLFSTRSTPTASSSTFHAPSAPLVSSTTA